LAQLAADRRAARYDEAREAAAVAEEDAKLVAATEALVERQRLMAGWDAQWSHFRAREEAHIATDRARFDARWATEEAELERRADLVADEATNRAAVVALAAEKHRYLTESTAWAEDWARQSDTDWARYRAECLAVTSGHMTGQEEMDEEERALKAKLKRLTGKA